MATIRNNTLGIITMGGGRGLASIDLPPGMATKVPDAAWDKAKKHSQVRRQLEELKTEDGKAWLEEVDDDQAAPSPIVGRDGTGRTPGGEHADDSKAPEEQTAPLQTGGPSPTATPAQRGPSGELGDMTVVQASERIKATNDRAMLERWRDEEEDQPKPRKTVLDAIDHRLDELDQPPA